MDATKQVNDFLKTSLHYYGKEVGIQSGQYFGIDRVIDKSKKPGVFSYAIQYGYPQSGAVCLDFEYDQNGDTFTVTKVEVYAPPEGEDIVMASYTPEEQVGEIGISINFGLDMGTIEHSGLAAIGASPNAIKMLEIATRDLEKAEVLGECRVAVEAGSDRIPVTDSRAVPKRTMGQP